MPGHGDGDVDAEHAGEDGGGQVGGELEQRGGAVSGGLESELAESLGECVRADRAPGLPAGGQPWRGTEVADGGFSATVRRDREGKRGNGFGQHDGLVAETEKDLPGAVADVVDRQPADRGGSTVQIMAERPERHHHGRGVRGDLAPAFARARCARPDAGSTRSRFPRPASIGRWCGHPISRIGRATRPRSRRKEPISGRKRFRGVLEGIEGEEVRIEVELDQLGRQVVGLPLALIAEARLVLTDELIRETLRRAQEGKRPRRRPQTPRTDSHCGVEA